MGMTAMYSRAIPSVEQEIKPATVMLRSSANDEYVICVTRSGCKNGGWIHMWKYDDKTGVYCRWELFDGVLRSKADPKYVLCVRQDGLTNGGHLHMWTQGEAEDSVDDYGKWDIEEGVLRAKANSSFCLCVTQSGLKNGGWLHMWNFDGAPADKYGTWNVEKIRDDNSSATFDILPGERLLLPVVQNFEAALKDPHGLYGEPFIKGVELFSAVLDKMGGSIGDYLLANTEKLRRSQADPSEDCYRPWLLSELPIHAETGYKSYVNDSAWMGNLWIAYTLEFFVDMFARLARGDDTKTASEKAYSETLAEHHNIFQRSACRSAVAKLPQRAELFKLLGQGASESDVLQDISAFVKSGHTITEFCLQMDLELDKLRSEQLGH